MIRRARSALLAVSVSASLATLALSAPRARAAGVDCPTASEQGQRLRDDGKYLRAREMFRQCSRDACPSIVRKDCVKWLQQLEDAMPSVVLAATDESGKDVVDARVSINGEQVLTKLDGKPLDVDPGQHELTFELPGRDPIAQTVVIRAGEKNRVISVHFAARAPQPSAPPAPSEPASAPAPAPAEPLASAGRPGAWRAPVAIGLAAVGVAGGASFAVFGLMGKGDLDHLRATCAPHCAQPDLDAVKTKMTIADVSLAVGVVAVGAAAVIYFTRPSAPVRAARVDVRPTRGGGTVSLAAEF